MIYKTKNPLFVDAKQGVQTPYIKQTHNNAKCLSKSSNCKKFSRDRLPAPKIYYAEQFLGLKFYAAQIWISVRCCFHEDTSPSLRINLMSGAFRCFACGVRGGDIIAFHQQRYSLAFRQAVSFFNAWGDA